MTESATRNQDPAARLPENSTFLVVLVLAPTIWMAHFFVSYVTAAVWCARVAGPGGSLGPVRSAIAVYTAIALVAIVTAGWSGFRRHRHEGGSEAPHDEDTPEDRHRFLGYATLLLAGLSAVATILVGLSSSFFDRCV